MATFPKNHKELYFDGLVRTQKAETLLSMIQATYHTKTVSDADRKVDISARLKDAYNLFRDNPKGTSSGAGSYTGSYDSFESQYTMGLEMAIWKNSNLELSDLALEVAKNNITIRDYLDIIFLNYVQPIKGKNVHLLYEVLNFLESNNTLFISKNDLKNLYGTDTSDEARNSLLNYLIATNYFVLVDKELKYVGNDSIAELKSKCDLTYIGVDGYEKSKTELLSEEDYMSYISKRNVSPSIQRVSKIAIENSSFEELVKILKDEYEKRQDTGIRYFGIKYGQIIKENNYKIRDFITAAHLNDSYYQELRKGINLSDLVTPNDLLLFNQETNILVADEIVESLPKIDVRKNTLYRLNSIIYGAPGTGKTYSLPERAVGIIDNTFKFTNRTDLMAKYNQLVSDGRIVFTTFHQSFSYEDFIQGLKPVALNGQVNFEVKDGVFKKIADKAMKDPQNNYVIIIDEINRGNISKIFGELITLIEEDKRWGELNQLSITLPSGSEFAVPNNLYIIGTMNSADKSIALIDTALRRRFSFVEVSPNLEFISNKTYRDVLSTINIELRKHMDSSDMLIGHAYFMNDNISLVEILNENIIPLLYEYFYDSEKKVKDVLKKVSEIEGVNITIDENMQGRLKVKENA